MATRSMRGRLTILSFVLYVALDLSNPFHPGAFNFNPEECVEAAQREQQQSAAIGSVPQAQRLRQQVDEIHRVARRAPAPAPRAEWRAPVPVAHAAAPPASPPPAPEDH
jgi:hypothetical protein